MDETIYKYNAFGKEEPKTPKPMTIVLRSEQRQAVDEAKAYFGIQKKGQDFIPAPDKKQFLWNAKMRFGKTICALELAREMNVRRTLIVTHRPVVNENFYEDFGKIFFDISDHWKYGTKQAYFVKEHKDACDFYDLEKFSSIEGNHYIFFASLQYLRRSTLVGGDNDDQLKKDILNTDWDLVVVDEAHEGTQTNLGQKVIDDYLKKATTKVLLLTGTPFNLLGKLDKTPVFTWDYTMEQNAKREWPIKHQGEPNPYAELPQMKIYTYSLGNLIGKLTEGDEDFNFTEFFRTWTGNEKADHAPMPEGKKGKFVHEDAVNKFLDKLCEESKTSNYPFSKEVYQENFHHTLWIVPGVKEAKALEQLLHDHTEFGNFDIKNVAGQNNEDEERDDALDKVKKAIGDKPEDTYTITLSCGRLTTGVTVPAWTAVLYMRGSELTSASTYMQTIFRVQSPCIINGRMKTECYVFDFSPDRTLKMIAETAKYATRAKQKGQKKDKDDDLTQEERDKKAMQDFIDLCPVISLDGGSMKALPVDRIFGQLERVYIDRLVRNGFNDNCLYNTDELMKMDSEALNRLGRKIAQSTNIDKPKKASPESELNWNQLTPEQKAALEEARRKAKENRKKHKDPYEGLTPEEIQAIEAEKDRKKKEREEREKRISNIRGIALRIPLMMYGGSETGDPNEPLTVENFTRKIKDESWAEFMPRGVTKSDFNYVRRVFNATRFEEAGKRYRALAKEADNMHVEDRIQRISDIFDCFHNPDKETVLTPWSVVNLHMSETLGGYSFFNTNFDGPNTKEVINKDGTKETVATTEPRLIMRPSKEDDNITRKVFGDSNTKILEINSKTGLYPLYVTYSLYRHRLNDFYDADLIENKSVEEEQVVWDDIVENNIFVICKSPMAVRITNRTLTGFRTIRHPNVIYFNIIKGLKESKDNVIAKIKNPKTWSFKTKEKVMRFNAIIGNPPYQGSARVQLYPSFYLASRNLGNIVSLIFPTGWQKPCAPTAKGLFKLNNSEVKADNQIVFIDNRHNVFPKVTGANEVNIILWEKGYNNQLGGKQLIYNDGKDACETQLEWEQTGSYKPTEIQDLARIVASHSDFVSLEDQVSAKDPFGIPTDLFAKPEKYPTIGEVTIQKVNNDDIRIFGGIEHKRAIRFLPQSRIPKENKTLKKYKVFVPWAWGNMDEKAGLGGAYADIILAHPYDACSMTYNTCGCFESRYDAFCHCKYMLTKFFRGLLYMNKDVKTSSRTAYSSIPVQDYKEEWWKDSIEQIDQKLFEKYNIPTSIRDFLDSNIQSKDESNIIEI